MYIFNKRILALTLIVISLLISGCSSKTDDTVPTDTTPVATEASTPSAIDEATEEKGDVSEMTEEEKVADYGEKVQKLDEQGNMDDVVFVANGVKVTRKEYETLKLTNEYRGGTLSARDTVDALVLKIAIEAEAEKYGVAPTQKDIDAVVNQTKSAMETDEKAREATYAYIESLGMTEDEYWVYLEDTVKEMYLRKGLEEYVKANKGVTDFNTYCYELVQNVTVEFTDSELEKEYNN